MSLFLLITACNLPAQTATPVGTILPDEQVTSTIFPTELVSLETPTALIPVTGNDEVSLQCQFCVNTEPHAVLIVSELATYHVTDSTARVTCLTSQVTNGRRILLCRGAPESTFNLNVCSPSAGCLQYPVTLEVCPMDAVAGAAQPTAVVLTPINAGVVPTTVVGAATTQVAGVPPAATVAPTQTAIVATAVVLSSATGVPTQTSAFVPLATATSLPTRVNPTRPVVGQPATPAGATPQPGITQPAGASLQDPGEFVRWYFGSVWQTRNYQDLWNNYLTASFRTNVSANSYDEYAAWWNLVERVDVNSVDVMQSDGARAWVRVNVTFTMKDGRVISNQQYDYDLLYDATRRTWMFDYRTA